MASKLALKEVFENQDIVRIIVNFLPKTTKRMELHALSGAFNIRCECCCYAPQGHLPQESISSDRGDHFRESVLALRSYFPVIA